MDTALKHATVIDWIPPWSAGAPCPQVFSNGHETYSMYYVEESDPNWDGCRRAPDGGVAKWVAFYRLWSEVVELFW